MGRSGVGGVERAMECHVECLGVGGGAEQWNATRSVAVQMI